MSEPTSFSRTLRALDSDGMAPTVFALVLIGGLAGVWTAWLLAARVPVYELSETARLEVEHVHPVAATVSGRVTATRLELGREVQAGEILLEVEAEREHLQTSEERARAASLAGEVAALEREIDAEEQAQSNAADAARAALEEAVQRLSAAEFAAREANAQVNRLSQLQRHGLIPAAEAETARAEASGREAEVAALRAALEKLRSEQTAVERGRRARVAALVRQRVGLEGLQSATKVTVAQREREADLRRLRAPVAGRLGEVHPVQVGAYIAQGDRLASIVTDSGIRAVAEFAAPALGRVRPGQPARIRLAAFPWTQYGELDATVATVASETRQQRVRVEFRLESERDTSIPLQHGMPGTAQVEIERVAPAVLLLRTLGHVIGTRGTAAEPLDRAPASPTP